MDKRYQVFVSSTYVDLKEERQEVIKALLELDCIPCGMEYFPAASEDSWTYIAELIDQCDYYVVIVGGRYGSVNADGVSFTQKEYEYAQTKGLPCIGFIHAQPESIPVGKTEESDEGRKKLQEFVSLLKESICKEWTSHHELGAVVSRSITQLIKRHPRTGWIPANQAGDPKVAEENLKLSRKISELESDLKKVRGRASIDTSDLADGNETIEVEFDYSISEYTKHGSSKVVGRFTGKTDLSWKDIFRAISPKIAPLADDASIKRIIGKLVSCRFQPETRLKSGQRVSGVTVKDDVYDVITIQLQALGLVTIGKEQDEYGNYSGLLWRLTEIGEARIIHSLAIKSKRTPS